MNLRYKNFGAENLMVNKIYNTYGLDITPGANPSGAPDFYVDGNTTNGVQDGKSWATAYKTIAAAISASNTAMGLSMNRYWAKRARIFVCGDTLDETLVAFPNKCDVIGVGSYDANTMPGIKGHHAPVNTGNYGTRFINVKFNATATNTAIVTLVNSSSGIQFLGCEFDMTAGTVNGAILSTASPFLKVIDCRMRGACDTACISIAAGEAGATLIQGNIITGGAAVGILINSSTTTSWESIIKDNFIEAATITIDDNSDLFYVIGNDLISLAVGATVGTMANEMQCDINVFRASGNRLACSNVCGIVVPPVDSTT